MRFVCENDMKDIILARQSRPAGDASLPEGARKVAGGGRELPATGTTGSGSKVSGFPEGTPERVGISRDGSLWVFLSAVPPGRNVISIKVRWFWSPRLPATTGYLPSSLRDLWDCPLQLHIPLTGVGQFPLLDQHGHRHEGNTLHPTLLLQRKDERLDILQLLRLQDQIHWWHGGDGGGGIALCKHGIRLQQALQEIGGILP